QPWATDASVVSGGIALQEPNTTVITAGRFDPKLFMNQRWGAGGTSGPSYSFPVSNGQYAVNLYFVDTYAPTCAKGARIFDVLVEAKVALSNLDIFDQATGSGNVPGCNRGLVMTVPATVTDGALNITFAKKTQYPRIDAIEILPAEKRALTPQAATSSPLESNAFPASAAIDGNLTTRWSSIFADGQWLAVDLGASYPIGRIVLTWEAAYAKVYRIETSADGTNWTSAYRTTTGVGGVETITLNGVLGRYVRLFCEKRGTAWGNSLWEMAIYPADGPVTPTTYTVGGTVSGLNGTVVLKNGAESLTVTANGSFSFPTKVAHGSAYSTTVITQPSGQTCSVANASSPSPSAKPAASVMAVDRSRAISVTLPLPVPTFSIASAARSRD
ncbi:MAG: secreted protein, partial [Halothiobacillaceae bacterium]